MVESTIPSYDLAIIGGGINGAGLAVQAVQAGLSVILLEKGDFASGTSSKSTKLLHGGIRYLEQFRLKLVFEALHERQKLLKIVPHLAQPVGFLLPVYKSDRRPAWMLKAGLWLYDLLAGSHNIARHEWFSKQQTAHKFPKIDQAGLVACGLYYDAQVNDARLVLENILMAEFSKAQCLNYCKVIGVEDENGRARVTYHDERSGETKTVSVGCLVNASGPWANETAKLLSDEANPLVRPTRGSHIVVPEVLSYHAVLITTPDDRVIFVIPWRGCSLVGTTDLDDSTDPDKTRPTEEEIQYLLKEASRVFPSHDWNRDRVIAAFSGLRPLAWAKGGNVSSISREDKIISNGNKLTIVGGKLTTYRAMGTKALEWVLKTVKKTEKPHPHGNWLYGTPTLPWSDFLRKKVPEWVATFHITQEQAFYMAHLYGHRTDEVLSPILQDRRLLEKLHPERPEIAAQVAYSVQKEKAFHLEDVLLRRLEIGYTAQRWGESSVKTSQLMASLLGWDEGTRKAELERYRDQLFPKP